ncbi:MAG: glycosyltransferase [Planctomycetota bacterium]|nr:MAG: glycosyltransferase [Planctomycetota bacterium]
MCDTPAVKVLFITQKKDAPSTKWRLLQFVPHLEKAGVTCTVEEMPSNLVARLSQMGRASGFDVTILQKRLLPKLILNRLRKHAKALIFEFDDVVTLKRDDAGSIRESPTKDRRFRRTVRVADAVVTTNETLADHARRMGAEDSRVHVLPTVIDLARWAPRSASAETKEVTIGWMGTPSNLPSVEIVRAPLVRLCRRYDKLKVKIVCESAIALEGVRLIHQPFSAEYEVSDVRSFDIAIAPLVEDPWTRGKVSTKLLAYFGAGLPVVASDVNANRIYIKDGDNGYLVGTLGQWEEKLTKLIEDPALRASVGAKARESAEKQFSLAAALPKYLSLFEQLTKK